jgi:hypothetical protein
LERTWHFAVLIVVEATVLTEGVDRWYVDVIGDWDQRKGLCGCGFESGAIALVFERRIVWLAESFHLAVADVFAVCAPSPYPAFESVVVQMPDDLFHILDALDAFASDQMVAESQTSVEHSVGALCHWRFVGSGPDLNGISHNPWWFYCEDGLYKQNRSMNHRTRMIFPQAVHPLLELAAWDILVRTRTSQSRYRYR